MADKRRHIRVPLNSKVIVINNDDSMVNVIRDISVSGAFIETVDLPKIGSNLYLFFSVNHPEKTVQTAAKVVRIIEPILEEDNFIVPGMGVEFMDVPFDSSILIEDYVVHVRYIYEELLLIISMKEPDMRRLGQLLKKINIGQYKDFFELKDKIRKTCYALGILKEGEE
ncbi:MAG: PilZ domain-containing protein [Proteobacteria bacterium]|nr:PilZ domain-containing protein [Pseudomonadota bacterium]